MVRISEDLIRKRAEHNEMMLSTLEEVSLHQQEIERIEFIDKWCKELKILYLQSNLIPRIENVSHLKKLEYLNLALNNVEEISGLEKCESLKKLDLTVNFVGRISSVKRLQANAFLEELYLTGNPCAQFEGYRDYVVATLPQLISLDGVEIEKSERITAQQNYRFIEDNIMRQEREYLHERELEKGAYIEEEVIDDHEFWQKPSKHTPEARVEIQKRIEKQNAEKEGRHKEPKEVKPPRSLFDSCGNPLNINEAKIDFSFEEDDENQCYTLELPVYKHMDTSLIDVDVQTKHVCVKLKGKVFQLTFPREVNSDSSSAKRSQITGHLLITMPYSKPVIRDKKSKTDTQSVVELKKAAEKRQPRTQYLEVDPNAGSKVELNMSKVSESERNAPYRPSRLVAKSITPATKDPNLEIPDDLPPLDEFSFS